jgi:hypothetical protein
MLQRGKGKHIFYSNTLEHNNRTEDDYTSSFVYRYMWFYSIALKNGNSEISLYLYTLRMMFLCFIILCTVPDNGSNVNRNMLHM